MLEPCNLVPVAAELDVIGFSDELSRFTVFAPCLTGT